MIKFLAAFPLCLLFLWPAAGAPAPSPTPFEPSRCAEVRTANVDLEAYQGKWFTIVSDRAFYLRNQLPDRGGSCSTTNITIRETPTPDGFPALDLYNCIYLRKDDQVACALGRANATAIPGRLTAQTQDPAPYLIVNVFGPREQGYRVALIYSCSPQGPEQRLSESFFILSRTPRLRFGFVELLFYLLRFRLLGIRLAGRVLFYPQVNCKYFDTVPEVINFFGVQGG